MKNTIFIPHQITDENSLPKVEGVYFALVKHGRQKLKISIYFKKNEAESFYWINSVIWWLEERELPSEEEIKEKAKEWAGTTDSEYHDGLIDGTNLILSKLK